MKLTRPSGRPLVLAAAGAVLCATTLAGCGVAGTGFSPGVAARVGDTSITVDRVDALAGSYCEAIEGQLEGQRLPNRYLSGGVAGQLALAAAAEQLGAEHGVRPGTQYAAQRSELKAAVASLPEDQAEAVVEVESAGSLVSDVVVAVGTALAQEQGSADPTPEEVAELGNRALAEWIEDNDVEVNPRYGVALEDGQPVDVDTDTSVAVGDTARTGAAAEPDQEYAGRLPESQRCG